MSAQLCSLLKSDFHFFCSFILSHPLRFTLFFFFFSYFYKLLSFLFPLFLTTSLFLLAFLSFLPDTQSSASGIKVTFLPAAYHALVEALRSKIDNQRDEYLRLEDFEVFRAVFDHPSIRDAEIKNAPVLACSEEQDFSFSPDGGDDALPSETGVNGFAELMESDLEDDQKKLDHSDNGKVTSCVEKTKIVALCTEAEAGANKAAEAQRDEKSPEEINGSEAAGGDKIRRNNSVGKEKGRDREYKSKLLKAHSHSIGASADYTNDDYSYTLRIQSSPALDYSPLGSYGSMRKEKEWKRTLACKLFEERNNTDESEGMDLLWETYETESAKSKKSSRKQRNHKNKNEMKHREEEEKEEEEEEEEDSESDGQLCCLQALKFSTGKMNLGMGRPNLLKISKAIKGMGWLHGLKKHSKKVHNGDKY